MKIEKVAALTDAKILACKEAAGEEVFSACGSDMMSDVLAYGQGQALLLTGLLNQQVIRTAEMLDMRCIVFVRGKVPADEVLSLAAEKGITALTTRHGMFTCGGLLYQAGIRGV